MELRFIGFHGTLMRNSPLGGSAGNGELAIGTRISHRLWPTLAKGRPAVNLKIEHQEELIYFRPTGPMYRRATTTLSKNTTFNGFFVHVSVM
jgi:hypothetical protein